MIVDCHMHVWQHPAELGLLVGEGSEPRSRLAADVADHMAAMEPVDLALVWGFASRCLGVEVPISFLGQHVGLQSHRLIGIAGLDPTNPAWRDKLFEAIDDWGFRGVTISPAAQDLHPLDSRATDLYEVCLQRNLPVMFDLPAAWRARGSLAFARPDLLDGVAREFRGLRILIAGFGYPFIEETLVLLEKFDTVFTDLSHLALRPLAFSRAVALAAEAGVLDKVLFGSGFPFARPRDTLAAVYRQGSPRHTGPLLAVPPEDIDELVHRDSLALLGIPRPEGFVEPPAPPAEDAAEQN
jgi:hypothetical protein